MGAALIWCHALLIRLRHLAYVMSFETWRSVVTAPPIYVVPRRLSALLAGGEFIRPRDPWHFAEREPNLPSLQAPAKCGRTAHRWLSCPKKRQYAHTRGDDRDRDRINSLRKAKPEELPTSMFS